jgi:hypothetical protein
MDVYSKELHKPIKRKFERRKVVSNGKDNIFGADLVDMTKLNDGEYRYILTVIDIFTKYAWAIPLKSKSSNSVLEAFKSIIEKSHRKPLKLWVDSGSEFYNTQFLKYLKDNEIDIYSVYNEGHNPVIERFNRTLKTEMWRRFTEEQTERWAGMIPDLLKWYNNKKHSTIKMTPYEASQKENEIEILQEENERTKAPKRKRKPKFKVGDKVRISKLKKTFEKGYKPNWTKEIFTISKILNTNPITYKIKDYEDNDIDGSFYEPELQKSQTNEVYLIEKVLKKQKGKVFVKWLGFDSKYNSWINESELYDLESKNLT